MEMEPRIEVIRREPHVDIDRNERRDLVFRSAARRPLTARLAVQLVTLAVVIFIGWQFAVWVGHLEQGRIAGTRPPGVEGFLPISALISLRHLLVTGDFSRIHPAGLMIFSLAMLSGLLLKKAFCSWLCPIGTASEWLARTSHRVFGRRIKLPRWLDYTLMSLKYLLLGYFIFAVFIQMSPTQLAHFIDSPYNKVADIMMLHFFQHISTVALTVIGALVVLSFLVPYFWCRFLCPYGALLGILSWLSPLKIRRDTDYCTDCTGCAAVCPSFIAVDRKLTVNSPECTGCLECVHHCPVGPALEVRTIGRWRRTVRPAVFAAAVVLLFYGGIGMAKLTGHWRTAITDREFLQRVQEIDDPKYYHARGEVPDYGPED
jgi:polyferredoxin